MQWENVDSMLRACLPETKRYGRNLCISCFFIPLWPLRQISLTDIPSLSVQRNVSQWQRHRVANKLVYASCVMVGPWTFQWLVLKAWTARRAGHAATRTICSTAPDNHRFLGLIRLKNLMKEHLLICQGNTIAAIVFSPESSDTRL